MWDLTNCRLSSHNQYVKVARNQKGIMELGGNMPGDCETKLLLVFDKRNLVIEDRPDQSMITQPSSGSDDVLSLPFPLVKLQTRLRRLTLQDTREGLGTTTTRRKTRSLSNNSVAQYCFTHFFSVIQPRQEMKEGLDSNSVL